MQSKQDATTYLKGIGGYGGVSVCLFLFLCMFVCVEGGEGVGRGFRMITLCLWVKMMAIYIIQWIVLKICIIIDVSDA